MALDSYGWLSHVDPLTFDPNDYTSTTNGFALFLTQLIIIIVLCQLLGKAFQRMGQPAVVGELLAGILLGPTALGNIPGFTHTIIPQHALGLLKLMANIGLSLFLFLVGLETDTHLMARYWEKVLLITLPGMAIPFGIAVGIARLIWQLETDQTVQFTTFFLFVGTVMAVTSLSVLSRIMAEMRILSTTLGAITIAAGVCNDLIGYILLALASALAAGGKQIDALFELLAAAGYVALLWFAFRPTMAHLIRRSGFNMAPGAADRVPEHLVVVALVGALVSAFYTESIGVHPIVGAFAFGVCCPHGNFAVKITESIETLVMMVLLPLYFVTSGLSTNFKLLDTRQTWALIVLLVVGIFVSKFGATALSARLAGLPWRQAMCVASLMQSKGIIEIIILNVALQLEVVSPRVFAMLVICFLCTTISVRPLSRYVYFSAPQQQVDKASAAATATDAQADVLQSGSHDAIGSSGREKPGVAHDEAAARTPHFAITVAITSPNPAIQALMSLIHLLGQPSQSSATAKQPTPGRLSLDLIRLLAIEYAMSSIMQLIHYSDDRKRDEMLESLKTVQWLRSVPTSATLAAERGLHRGTAQRAQAATMTAALHRGELVLPPDTFSVPRSELTQAIAEQHTQAMQRLGIRPSPADDAELGSGMAIVSWEQSNSFGRSLSWLGAAAAASGLSNYPQSNDHDNDDDAAAGTFWQAGSDAHALPARIFKDLRHVCATGVLVDQSLSGIGRGSAQDGFVDSSSLARRRLAQQPPSEPMRALLERRGGRRRVLVPFFGGADDRAAVELLKRIVAASGGGVEGVVVSLASWRNNFNPLGRSAGRAPAQGATTATATKTEAQEEAEKARIAEEENGASINLATIHQDEAARVDARFLFDQQAKLATVHEPSGGSGGALSESTASLPDACGNDDIARRAQVQTTEDVHFITLAVPDVNANADANAAAAAMRRRPIQSILDTLSALVDGERDLVLVGRGKLGQRPKEFRIEVEEMYAVIAQQDQEVRNDNSGGAGGGEYGGATRMVDEETRTEYRIMGKTLGAATEGLLLSGLGADMLVVQACRRMR
ncbi:hypothetical protein ACQY0O_002609 [Thecaphora frezii]